MFILLFVGGIFVALVARNLLNAGRSTETVSALQLAQAGIRYADYYLQFSADGADWRPAPTPATDPRDPDKTWLDLGYSRIDFPRGRALVKISYSPQLGDPNSKYLILDSIGRVGLLNPNDPTTFLNTPAPRLRRELLAYKAIGITDYLRFITNISNDSKALAFLGVPSISAPLAMQLGKLDVRAFYNQTLSQTRWPGAPIRANESVQFSDNLALSPDNKNLGDQILVAGKVYAPADANAPVLIDGSTGNKMGQIYSSDDSKFSTYRGLIRDAGPNPDPQGYARGISRLEPPRIDAVPDPATGVTRYRQLTRDSGRWLGTGASAINTGSLGFGAGVYLNNLGDAEQETTIQAGGQSLRSLWTTPGSHYWSGPFYVPPGVFVEPGYILVQEGTQPAVRPGLRVIRNDAGFSIPVPTPTGITMTTFKELDFTFFIYKAANQRPVIKLDNQQYRAFLTAPTANGGLAMSDQAVDASLPAFNGVIFAEGNIRTRGLLPAVYKLVNGQPLMQIRRGPGADNDNVSDNDIYETVNPPALTMVSNASIYVEGSLVREAPDQPAGGRPVALQSIALLAENYVTVNTTMFAGPAPGAAPPVYSASSGQPSFYADMKPGAALNLFEVNFGDDPGLYTYTLTPHGNPTGTTKDSLNLLLYHGTPTDTAFLNLFVNRPAGGDPSYYFSQNAPPWTDVAPPPQTYAMPGTPISGGKAGPRFEKRPFPLMPRTFSSTYAFFTAPGMPNVISPAADSMTEYPQYTGTVPVQDYLLSRLAVAPMDVRIEAVIYAQNGSFFVIPGYSLNTDPADTRDAALRAGLTTGNPGAMVRPANTYDWFPFYGEPYDCRITVVGAVSENRTASEADQAAWMAHWGYIPVIQGSTGFAPGSNGQDVVPIPDQHVLISDVGDPLPPDIRTPGEKQGIQVTYAQNRTASFPITRGLRFIYDPFLYTPYAGYTPGPAGTLLSAGSNNWKHFEAGAARQDDYGRTLPPIPALPVCPGFVFYGEVR